jgi:protein-disulfide isomerase
MRSRLVALVTGALLALTALAPLRAASQGISGEQADAILQELRAIRQLLERGPAPAAPRAAPGAPPREERVTLAPASAWELGRPDAPVTLVEFTDLECPFCRRFHVSTYEELKRNHIDTGKLRFVTRDLPLDFHPHALGAASASRCAGEQGKYWELRHVMLVNGARLQPEAIRGYARDLGLDAERLQACIDSGRHLAAIRQDIAAAQAAGLTGTPSFVLGRTTGSGVEGVKIVGAQPYAVFDARIRELLSAR